MSITKKFLAAAVSVAALATGAPAAAQYYGNGGYNGYSGYNGYNTNNGYSYGAPYGNAYGAMDTNAAAQQCSAAVQNRLYNRASIGGILGAVLGTNTSGRVVAVTQVQPRGNGMIRVRGLASSGRMAYNNNGYGPYGVGAYGSLGYGYNNAADLSFRCDVDMNGYVRNVDINRR